MIVAIIQARMGSNRLPGKVMKKVLDKPLIAYLLERVSKSKYIKKIIVATTTNKEDDVLVEFLTSLDYEVFRGSEDDVLSRYFYAYSNIKNIEKINGVVRITGDCPLIDIEIVDKVISIFFKKKLQYASTGSTIAEGLDIEIMRPELLIEAFNNANLASEREHVALYIHNNKTKFKYHIIKNETDDGKYRLTVDQYEDFLVIKNIIEYFHDKKIIMNIKNIKKYLDDHVDIYALNSYIIRNEGLLKSLKEDRIIKKDEN